MQEIILGVALFTGIVLALAAMVLTARSYLMPSGNTTLTVNDDQSLNVPLGSKLLDALTDNNMLIPAACGGTGSCGQCRVKVLEGGGSLLPVESSFISRREAAEGLRLACQVTIQKPEPMRIWLPDTVLSAKSWQCRVRSCKNVATYIRELVFEMPSDPVFQFRAGGYVMIEAPPYQLRFTDFDIAERFRKDWKRNGLLDLESTSEEATARAYSIANYPDEKDIVMLNVRIATPPPGAKRGTPPGIVSSFLFGLKPGDMVEVSGPFGEFFVQESGAEMIFVGGGAGMAPLRSHILDQLLRVRSQRKISYWYGARSLREAFYVEQFERLAAEHDNFTWHLVLSEPLPEDEWSGLSGFIHQVIYEQYLKDHPEPEDCEYYLCGPPMMIAALSNLFDELGVEKDNIFFDDFGD
ncbi:MAG: NADH:ubiquinone reductase (Na(+)-transporting) subunit F [Gammaproteobacteria bacterium]